MGKKHTVGQLIVLALLYAIQDREAMVEACHSSDPERARAAGLVAEFERLLQKRTARLSPHAQDREDLASGKIRSVAIENVAMLPHDGSGTIT